MGGAASLLPYLRSSRKDEYDIATVKRIVGNSFWAEEGLEELSDKYEFLSNQQVHDVIKYYQNVNSGNGQDHRGS